MRFAILTAILFGATTHAGVCSVSDFKARSVIGHVCYEKGGQCIPIPGARVELRRVTEDDTGTVLGKATADGAGLFRIECPSSGKFWIRASANGFVAVSGRLIATRRAPTDHRIRVVLGWDMLAPCGGGYMKDDLP